MKIKCIGNRHQSLNDYEYKSLDRGEFGRFGISSEGEYSITVGKEYLVMGMIQFDSYLSYLIDDSGLILTVPCYLFAIIDPKICTNCSFRLIDKQEEIYPFVQAIWGYADLCFNKQAYVDLIVEMTENAQRIYFRRKIELYERCEISLF